MKLNTWVWIYVIFGAYFTMLGAYMIWKNLDVLISLSLVLAGFVTLSFANDKQKSAKRGGA